MSCGRALFHKDRMRGREDEIGDVLSTTGLSFSTVYITLIFYRVIGSHASAIFLQKRRRRAPMMAMRTIFESENPSSRKRNPWEAYHMRGQRFSLPRSVPPNFHLESLRSLMGTYRWCLVSHFSDGGLVILGWLSTTNGRRSSLLVLIEICPGMTSDSCYRIHAKQS